ncbi:unnamed protein product [Camellia sinensis]
MIDFQMPKVRRGTHGLEVSKLGYGCMGLTRMYNSLIPEEDGIAIIKYAFSKGITFFDTSYIYGADNANEILVGKCIKAIALRIKENKQTNKHKLKHHVTVGGAHYQLIGAGFRVQELELQSIFCVEYVRSYFEASLKLLGVDCIYLYYVHQIDTSIPIEKTMGELKKLAEEGKIKYIGLSEASPNTIRRAHAVHPITALQMKYSLSSRDIEEEIIPICRQLWRPCLQIASWFTRQNLEHNKIFYLRIKELAKKHSCIPVQIALAWILHQRDDMVPIPGTTKIKNLDENIGAVRVKLTKDDLKEIFDAVPDL